MISLEWPSVIKAMLVLALFEGFSTTFTSACLLLVSINDIISIIVCVIMFLFAILYGFIAYRSKNNKFIRVCAFVNVILMPISGIACILVDDDFVIESSVVIKTPLYMIISVGLLINLSLDTILIIHRCKCGNFWNRLFTNNNQITFFVLINIVVGFGLGLAFGILKVEVAHVPTNRMIVVSIVFLFVGIIVGAIFGFYNEKETQKCIALDPSLSMSGVDYDRV